MRPKFEVGEEVILQSVSRPECKGEFTILEVHHPSEGNFKSFGHFYSITTGNCGYFLSDSFEGGIKPEAKCLWDETALRKKHKPSRMSFGDLMSSLKSPVNS